MIGIREMVSSGLGISVMPNFQAKPYIQNGSLERILPEWSKPPVPVSQYLLLAVI